MRDLPHSTTRGRSSAQLKSPRDAVRPVDTQKRLAAWLRQAGVTDDRRDLKTGGEGRIGLRIPTIARHPCAVRRAVVDERPERTAQRPVRSAPAVPAKTASKQSPNQPTARRYLRLKRGMKPAQPLRGLREWRAEISADAFIVRIASSCTS